MRTAATPEPSILILILTGIFGLKALEEFFSQFSGANCDENVADRGIEEGTTEYTEAVEECQDDAANRMMALGVAGIAVVGGVVWLLLK